MNHVTLGAFKRAATLAAVSACLLATSASAVDWKGRWWVGGRGSLWVHADSLGGGFRVNQQAFGTREEATVNLQDKLGFGVSLGRGVKSWSKSEKAQHVQMSVELDIGYIGTTAGKETGFRDENASTRILLPDAAVLGEDGDESYKTLELGDVTIVPVLGYALFHWGNDKADFYAGPGAGWVMAEVSESEAYRDFVGDYDGDDDVTLSGSFAVAAKLGSNIRLAKNGRWYLFLEASFYSTALVSGGTQLAWPGVEGYFGQRVYDTNDDGVGDTTYDADFRVVDSGKLRIDGAQGSFGLRYRFGSPKAAPAEQESGAEAAPEAVVP